MSIYSVCVCVCVCVSVICMWYVVFKFVFFVSHNLRVPFREDETASPYVFAYLDILAKVKGRAGKFGTIVILFF